VSSEEEDPPLESDDPRFRSLCCAIGFIVLNWALLEQEIDYLVNVAFIDCGGDVLLKDKDGKNKGPPIAIGAKVKFLKNCFRNLTSIRPSPTATVLGQYAAEALPLLSAATKLSDERHKLVHGAPATPDADHDGAYSFARMKYFHEGHQVELFTFDPPAFAKLHSELGDLITKAIDFRQRITLAVCAAGAARARR
jgi:hypothetical protein